MSQTANPSTTTKVVTGKVRLSYAHLWEPHAIEDGQKPKYSVSLIIPKSDKKTVNSIKKAIELAKEQGKGKWGGKIPANLKMPLRDGDDERPDDEAYEGSYFVNANCTTRPGIVDRGRNPIMDQEEVYSGCYVFASITFYAFNASGNKGIACGLNNIMKVADGESLGGRVSADVDFAEVELEDDDDLLG